jgi:hypothetical protein
MYKRRGEGKNSLEEEHRSKKQIEAKNTDLIDWVLAIDVCIK